MNLPEHPQQKIIYFVYNDDLVQDAENRIDEQYGRDYRLEHVTVRSMLSHVTTKDNEIVWFDESVFKNRLNGYN